MTNQPLNRLQRREAVWPRAVSHTLPDLCLSLRMAMNGSADPWPDGEMARAREYLRITLETWEPSTHPAAARFDAAVRELVEATLAELAY